MSGIIYVLAGVNGAGKSSVGGKEFRKGRSDYFNPDEATQSYLACDPGLSPEKANSLAWHKGRLLLERAIERKANHSFETTLGGNTITRLLIEAAQSGIAVRIWFAGLDSPERHIARVRPGVAKGGHDIPEEAIRHRYDSSRRNLIRLLPHLDALRVFDNSSEADPDEGHTPTPDLVLSMDQGRITAPADLSATPRWARPIVAAAMAM